VQDEGSQLAALVVTEMAPVTAGESILDMCSGPGGKAALVYSTIAGTGATLTAVEKAPHRAHLVEQALAPISRTEDPPRVLTGDAEALLAEGGESFDRILLDAPCTGLGALRRRPESRWRKDHSDVAGLVALQRRLLAAAVEHCVPGGIIVYVTCSPVAAETSEHMTWLTEHHPVALVDTPPIVEAIARRPLTGHRRGLAVQLWPHRHNTDAMFIQVIRRNG
jgi:16S rRNA (cytosine967-C5)-methyltransferase